MCGDVCVWVGGGRAVCSRVHGRRGGCWEPHKAWAPGGGVGAAVGCIKQLQVEADGGRAAQTVCDIP